jgi:hypothetical protein
MSDKEKAPESDNALFEKASTQDLLQVVTYSPRLLGAARSLLLPISRDRESELCLYILEQAAACTDSELSQDEAAAWVEREMVAAERSVARNLPNKNAAKAEFKQTAFGTLVANALFRKAAIQSLVFRDDEAKKAKSLSSQYAGTLAELSDRFLGNVRQARLALWHSLDISRQAEEGLSASEISRRMENVGRNSLLSLEVVQILLKACGSVISPSPFQFEEVLRQDIIAEDEVVGDATLDDASDLITWRSNSYGYVGDIGADLLRVIKKDGKHDPMAAILHFQLATVEILDHAPTYAYEFKPRGANFEVIKLLYQNSNLEVRGNAFLNNAKALPRFISAWASSRDFPKASSAMTRILTDLEGMPYPARREVARLARAILSRHLTLSRNDPANRQARDKLSALSSESIWNLVKNISQNATNTQGYLEQRLVDAWTVIANPLSDGWGHRGIGDSINAPNVMRAKIGDTEALRDYDGT